MKKLYISLVLFVFAAITAFTLNTLPDDFTAVLKEAKMTFNMPDSLVEAKIIPNDQVGYIYALKYPGKRFEVRYALMPLDSLVMQYEASKKDTSMKVIEPNSLFDKMFAVTAMNAAGGMVDGGWPQVQYFDSVAVKNEFNADKGGTIFIKPCKEFGQDYKYCMIVGIHKDNVADAYYFYLFDDKSALPALMKLPFHSLKFKAE